MIRSFVREHSVTLVAVGAGVILGAGVTVVVQRLTSHLSQDLATLVARIETLQQEVQQLKSNLDTQLSEAKRQRRHSGYYSIHASSGEDDDDEFQEAFEGYV